MVFINGSKRNKLGEGNVWEGGKTAWGCVRVIHMYEVSKRQILLKSRHGVAGHGGTRL